MRYKNKLKLFLLVSCLAFTVLFLGLNITYAAELNFSSPKLIEETENHYAIDLNLDTQGDNINVLEVSLNYSFTNFDLKNILTGDSVINFWIQKPIIKDGLIHFAGSIPAGYFGSKGRVLTMVFQPKIAISTVDFNILSDEHGTSRVFLNDPLATEKIIQTKHYSLDLPTTLDKNIITTIIDVDKPEPFTIEISPSSSLPINNVFVIFNAVDSVSGIDHYEMAQADLADDLNNNKSLKWQIVESPATLNISQAKRFLAIKAFDGSNNVELSVLDLKPSKDKVISQNPFTVIIVLVIIIGMISLSYYRRLRKK